MRRIAPTFGAALLCALTLPAAANAGTLVNDNGTLTYTARDGFDNYVSVYGWSTVRFHDFSDGDTVEASGCMLVNFSYTCEGVQRIVVKTGDGDDVITSSDTPMIADAGPGDDSMMGSWVADALLGGPGDDSITADESDQVSGGSGVDQVVYVQRVTGDATVTLDSVANDGPAGATGNYLADIEDVFVSNCCRNTTYEPIRAELVGNDASNRLVGAAADDRLTGGGGSDWLDGGSGADVLDARDGQPDQVDCSSGADTALVDQYDQVSASCETVLREERTYANDDRPPTVAWATGDRVRAGNILDVDATDDRAVTSVHFLDGARTLCTDTTAPFTCPYRPATGGPATLVAVATDAAGQTATAVQAVDVQRYIARRLSLRVTRRGTRYTTTGTLDLPAGARCGGSVEVRARNLGRTRASRTARLNRSCAYRAVFDISGPVNFQATFLGTDAVERARSLPRRPR